MQLYYTEFKEQSTLNAINYTNWNIIISLHGVVKANEKTNPPYLETKKSEPCSHSFKYANCQGDYQADLNQYLF